MPRGTSLPAPAALSRRALGGLAVATGLTALSACTEDGAGGPVLPVDPAADPDVALAVEAWSAETRLLQQVRATQRRHPRLRRRLQVVHRTHAAHVTVLARAVPAEELPTAPAAPAPPRRAPAALASLTRAEDALARSQARRAGRARSGSLARVLAGTAAAAAQQSHLLRGQA